MAASSQEPHLVKTGHGGNGMLEKDALNAATLFGAFRNTFFPAENLNGLHRGNADELLLPKDEGHELPKSHSPKKKLGVRSSLVDEAMCSGSGGSGSVTKETAFSFPTRHKKRDELSEAECDRSSPLHAPVYYRV
ncbi:Protein of unknown function [Gryllus bimaculatus]|nr:Protein of unknown function [Gryllus bimaculatus]